MTMKETRVARLAAAMRRLALGKALVEDPRHIFYLTGFSFLFPDVKNSAALVVEENGRSSLVVSEGLSKAAQGHADTIIPVAHSTVAPVSQRGSLFRKAIGDGYDALKKNEPLVDQEIRRMRAIKDADEIVMLRKLGCLAEVGYRAIAEGCASGRTELDLLLDAKSACVQSNGSDVFVSGDFVSGERTLGIGGEPTTRPLSKGENVIVDLWLVGNHYWNDSCRTFFVDRDAPPEKRRIIASLEAIHESARRLARPGVKGAEIFSHVQEELQRNKLPSCPHHIGHGIGLDFWEPPFITADSVDTIEEGMVFTIEIGVYGEEWQGGYRIEHVYEATAAGNAIII